MKSNSSPLLAERLALWSVRSVRENWLPLLSSLIFGILAYTYAFTNKLPNHDEVGQLFGKGATTDSGRWGLELMEKLFPNYSMPWIYGVITLVLMAISIALMIRLFCIRSKLLQVLLSGCVLVFPSLIGLFGYMFTSTSYAVSFLLAVTAVWLIRKWNVRDGVLALGCMVLSLGIYQSYISIAASFLVVLLIQSLLNGADPLNVLKRGIGYVGFLLVSLIGYYLATQVFLKLLGVSFNEYAAGATSFDLAALPEGIVTAYLTFVRYFAWRTRGLVPTEFSRLAHGLLFAACAVLLLLNLRKERNPLRLGLLAVLLGILPLAINCMYLITPAWSIHTLVLYSFVAIYVLAAVMADRMMEAAFSQKALELLRRGCLNLAALALALILTVNTYVANQAYLNLQLRYENAYAFFTALVSTLQQQEDFTPDTKLALVGAYPESWIYDYYFPFLEELQGVQGFVPTDYTNGNFLNYYLGLSIPMATQEELDAIAQLPQFQEMAVYPYYGSIERIGEFMVVRLS